jgi:hypothetical protein
MEFSCARCGYVTNMKGHLKRHLSSKSVCPPSVSDTSRDILLQQLERPKTGASVCCEWCEKTVSKANYARHRNVCSSRHTEQTENVPINSSNGAQASTSTSYGQEIDYEKLKKTMKEILQDLLKSNHGTINNTVININSNSNNTTNNVGTINNVNINSFGSENVSYLTHEFLSYCLMNPKKGMATLIENIHYNKDYPENHNVRCKSLKQNMFEKYIDSEWRICDASNTLDELIKKGYRILNAHYAEHFLTDPEFFENEMKQRALEKFRFLGDTTCNDYFAVKRDLRLLVKDRTMYLLESPTIVE